MRIAISQSNYLPWLGYFCLINGADTFVIYDSAQFTKNDWRNRNRIRSANGPFWITIPCLTSGRLGQSIEATKVMPRTWVRKHISSMRDCYGRSKFYSWFEEHLFPTMVELEDEESLSTINATLVEKIAQHLCIPTRIVTDRGLVSVGDPNAKLLTICKKLRASAYLSGPLGANYLDVNRFLDGGVRVEFAEYGPVDDFLRASPKSDGGRMSVIDTIAEVGPERLVEFLKDLRAHA